MIEPVFTKPMPAIANVSGSLNRRLVRQNLLTARGEDVILRVTGHGDRSATQRDIAADYQLESYCPQSSNCTFPICE